MDYLEWYYDGQKNNNITLFTYGVMTWLVIATLLYNL